MLNLRRPHLSVNLNRPHPSVNLIRPQRLQIPYNPCIGPQQPFSQGTPGLPPPTRLTLRRFVDVCARTQLTLYHGPASGLYRHALDVPREPARASFQSPKVGEVDPARPTQSQLAVHFHHPPRVRFSRRPSRPCRRGRLARPLRAALRSASSSASSCPPPALPLPSSSARDQRRGSERWPRPGLYSRDTGRGNSRWGGGQRPRRRRARRARQEPLVALQDLARARKIRSMREGCAQ